MNEPEDEVVVVRLRKRTLEEQVEYLILQYALVYASNEQLKREVENLRARLAAVERATPWQRPKTSPPLPKKP